MLAPHNDAAAPERWLRSLERSRARRATARAARRRRLRFRGGGGSLAALALATATLGVGLAAGHSASGTGGTALVSDGNSGSQVAAIQRKLGVQASGVYGKATVRAVRAFQRRNGLVVDGVVGPQTLGALGLGPAAKEPGQAEKKPSTPAEGGGSATLQRIALCESGGDPTRVSAGGRYRGKYQFDRQTWRAMGGTGDPAKAPEAEQDRRAAMLLAQRGTAPWSNCAG